MAGPLMYNQQLVTKGKTETITDIDFAGRLVFKLTKLGDNSQQLLTLYGTARGNFGASFSGYLSIGESELVGVEPFYGTRTGPWISIIFTTRL
jgi:hypothetical protein